MHISRESQIKIKYILEQLVPPIIRDAEWFNYLPFKFLFGKKSEIFFNFKDQAYKMSEQEYQKAYQQISDVLLTKGTDLNKKCADKILKEIKGKTVLEVGCGQGLLAKRLGKNYQVTAVDIEIDSDLIKTNNKINFKKANIEKLPFKNKSFDTVVSTHTLEHVQNIFQAISELRRVVKRRLILVVPKERPYKYTFNLHLHFFPYPHSLLTLMGNKNNQCLEVGGDLFYIEDV